MADKKEFSLIRSVFEIDPVDVPGEEDLIRLLTDRIAMMLDSEPELLMSTLYRLDVLEKKILAVLNNPAIPPAEGLAHLILDRQKEKLATREKYSSEPGWDWEKD